MSVEYRLEDHVAVVTLNRPERFNAVDQTLSDGLVEAARRAGSEAGALVVTGAGKAFCSGADLSDLMADYERGDPDLAGLIEVRFHPMAAALVECTVPTIAAVNGAAAGAGLGLALSCDLRVMSDTAFFSSAFTGIGLVPDSGTTWWLPHHIGLGRALEIVMSNRRVEADEAMRLGMTSRVVPGDQLLDESLQLAGELAAGATEALVATRHLLRNAAGSQLAAAWDAERETQGRLGRTPQHLEGVRAFTEKRPPDFHGASSAPRI